MKYSAEMTILIKGIFALSLTFAVAKAEIKMEPDLVRPWNQDDKSQFPTPLAAVFQNEGKSLVFVGDHHVDQVQTSRFVEHALKKYTPEIVVVENLDFSEGENPKKWMEQATHKSKEELLKDGGANRMATLLAFNKKIPVIGGEPSMDESLKSPFILSKGILAEDILYVQILQRLPYRRDILKMVKPDEFFDYAMKLYNIKEARTSFKTKFQVWYKKRTTKEFNYSNVTKEESAVNCLPADTFLQKVACAFNVNRDRAIVGNIEKLFRSYNHIMVVYGTGHYVQEYPVFLKAFGKEPKYITIRKANEKPIE